MYTQGIAKAVGAVGGVNALVRRVNARMRRRGMLYKGKPEINRYHINKWLYGKQYFPPELADVVSLVSGVSKRELRPDVFS